MAAEPAIEDADLNSDELGTKGETKFVDLCSDAKMQANKADRDRAGWDYVVHLALPSNAETSFDLRDNHATAFVQVKALWKTRTPRIRLRLSAVEKLAKQPCPAFLIAFEFNRTDISKFSIYIIEFTGGPLEWVLKELRKRQASGQLAVNSSYVQLSLKKAWQLQSPTGDALRERFLSSLPNGPASYAQRKATELKSVGFDEFRYKLTGTAEIEVDKIADVLLGRRPMDVLISSAFETRFGIPLPTDKVGPTTIRVIPESAPCSLHFVSGDGITRLSFEGRSARVAYPGPTDIIWKAHFDFGIFSVEHGSTGSGLTLNLSVEDEREFPIRKLVDFYKFLIALHKGNSLYKIRVQGLADPLEWQVPEFKEFDVEQLELRLLIFRALEEVNQDAGYPLSVVSPKQTYECQQDLLLAWGFGGRRDTAIRISVDSSESDDLSDRNLLYTGCLDISGFRFAYSAVVTMRFGQIDGKDRWFTADISPIGVRTIGLQPIAFADFVDDQKEVSGLSEVLLPEGNDEFYREALGELGAF